MSALPDAAEQARLDFAVAFKHLLGHPIKSALPHIYRERAEPAWAAQHGRAPESWQEVGEALSDTSAYRWWSALARSEEHTSELQSLMRISYAVFCLKKKKQTHNRTNHNVITK